MAEGINNRGEVVGISSLSGTAGEHAFIYTAANGMQDLNSLIAPASGLILVQAWDINDSGQITGLAFPGNQGRAFLLTPIAPSSYTVTIIPRIQVGNAVNDRADKLRVPSASPN